MERRIYVLVSLDIDTDAILADVPPENLETAIKSEIEAHLNDDTVAGALGVTEARTVILDNTTARTAARLSFADPESISW